MNKQELIKCLTDLMATVQMAYFKGRMEGHPLWVHEHSADGASISIDLYNFGGDGKPVCDGLKPCTITYDDNTQESGWLFCMAYDPDDLHSSSTCGTPGARRSARRLSPLPETTGSTSGTSGLASARNTACMELPSGSMPNSLTITATCS